MAKVTLLQQTNLFANMPTGFVNPNAGFSNSEPAGYDEVWGYNHAGGAAGSVSLFGVSDLISGVPATQATITRGWFDDGDPGIAPNIHIEFLSFTLTDAYYEQTVADGNYLLLLSDLLNGSDIINCSNQSDSFHGFAGNDVIHGKGGNDILEGGLGSDKIFGDAGADSLYGTGGRDILIGGPGADDLFPFVPQLPNDDVRDIMRLLALSDSGPTSANQDEIFGFIKGAGATADRIDLSPIDADPTTPGNQAFHLVAKFTAAKGEVRLLVSGGDTIVQVDGDSDPAIDMTIRVHATGLHGFDLIL